MKKKQKNNFFTNSKNLLIALLIIAAVLTVYAAVNGAIVSHTADEIEPGDLTVDSIRIIGSTSLPNCDNTTKGTIFLHQGGADIDDKPYFCKKKPDGTYNWVVMDNPRVYKGSDTSTTKTAPFFINGAVYRLNLYDSSIDSVFDKYQKTVYCDGVWRGIRNDEASLRRYCEERGQSYVYSDHDNFPVSPYIRRICRWSGSSWVRDDGSVYDTYLWCEDGEKKICKDGFCCPTWQDCDGDGYTYVDPFNIDCDETCDICYTGSLEAQDTPDGKDQNCDGIVDNYLELCGQPLTFGFDAECNWVPGGPYWRTDVSTAPSCDVPSLICCSCERVRVSNREPDGSSVVCGGARWYTSSERDDGERYYYYKCSLPYYGYY